MGGAQVGIVRSSVGGVRGKWEPARRGAGGLKGSWLELAEGAAVCAKEMKASGDPRDIVWESAPGTCGRVGKALEADSGCSWRAAPLPGRSWEK